MFVLPTACLAFGGVLPAVGTRVMYRVDLSQSRPVAEEVRPAAEMAPNPWALAPPPEPVLDTPAFDHAAGQGALGQSSLETLAFDYTTAPPASGQPVLDTPAFDHAIGQGALGQASMNPTEHGIFEAPPG